jgi:regulator of replication initiation timing
MSEELKPDVPAEGTPEQVEQPQHNEVELKAMEMGWRPKEEFDGDEDDFIDAKEFIRRKPLFDKIEQQGRQLKNTIKALEGFKQHYTKVKEVEYERALKSLKAERKEALREGDPDRFEELDEQIQNVEKEAEQIRAAHDAPLVKEEVINPQWQSWASRNRWYESVGYMRAYADQVGNDLHKRGMEPAEVLKEVEKAVRKEFPQKFTNPNKANAPAVESSAAGSKREVASEKFELTDVERKVMNDLVRAKVLTKEEYMNDLKKQKGVA